MGEVHADWKSLPFEILLKIFYLSESEQLQVKLHELALVCKAWTCPAREVLYSAVRITTLSQLWKFSSTVENNSDLGCMIKSFRFPNTIPSMDAETKLEILNFSTTLLSSYLTNLRVLENPAQRSYIPIFDALSNFELKRLKSLDPPTSEFEKAEVDNYVSCAILMKNRLENILISDDFLFASGANGVAYFMNGIYCNLNQFEKLVVIEIHQKTEEPILVLEHIVNSCKSLEEIKFNFTSGNNVSPNSGVTITAISEFMVRPNIKTITSSVNVSSDPKTLLYITHTFAHLDKAHLLMRANRPEKLDSEILIQLLYYVSKIKHVFVSDLKVDTNTITETIGSYWNATSGPGNESVHFLYSENLEDIENTLIDILKTNDSNNIRTTFIYPAQTFQWEHINFVEENGRYIRKMEVSFMTEQYLISKVCELPEYFLPHTFTYCPNIQSLTFDLCVLKPFTSPAIYPMQKRSISQLSFTDCAFYTGALEQLSQLLLEVKQLHLHENASLSNEVPLNEGSTTLIEEIIMPHTKIDSIIVKLYWWDPLYIKVFASSHKVYNYYRCNPKWTEEIEVSSEQEYENTVEGRHIHVRCKTLPKFEIEVVY